MKQQTTGSHGTPWYERKDRASYGNGGTRQIPPHVTRIKIPRGAVDRKLIEKHAYQGSQYSFNPNTTVYVKRVKSVFYIVFSIYQFPKRYP